MNSQDYFGDLPSTYKPEKRTLESGMSSDSAKKAKVDSGSSGSGGNAPSRVVHVRHLPDNVTEKEVQSLAILFGRVEKLLMMQSKGQALLEMADLDDAVKLVDFHSTVPANVRGQKVFLQFSNHKELKGNNLTTVSEQSSSDRDNEGNTILRVIIDNMVYPITLDILHEIFSKYGRVMKIITFNKNGQFHALIQFGNAEYASDAKMYLDGQNIYTGCCTLRIDYSTLTNLTVRYNDEKMRDYTRNDPGELDMDEHRFDMGGMPPPLMSRGDAMKSSSREALHHIARINELRAMADMLQKQLEGSVQVPGGGSSGTAGGGPMGSRGGGYGSRSDRGGGGGASGRSDEGGSVVLVSNLNEKMINNYGLFILFGCYGDVLRVKILYNKKDSALIQFAEAFQAHSAMLHLNGVPFHGKQLHLSMSKYSSVQMPRDGSSEVGLTKDYSDSSLHRFRRPGSKNLHHIHAPTEVLHISNIPSDTDEDELRKLFDEHGTVVNFKFFESNRRMALVEMSTVEESVTALIAVHNYSISPSAHLRVSFTKSTI
ncbi:polypyrimidine tract-binding protein 2-like [Dysidea avara]|uniref:polypyrimidine tract-binding protein 2-like n=1 Tax=Dysidea avara TaxID=196820 RepID=UPI00332FD817